MSVNRDAYPRASVACGQFEIRKTQRLPGGHGRGKDLVTAYSEVHKRSPRRNRFKKDGRSR